METIVSITGRLGTNVDLTKTNAGHDFASFRMATSRRLFKDGQWTDGPTSWITVKCFREFATNVSMSLRKGNAVLVVGRLEVEEWVTDQGVQRQKAVIYAHAIGHDLKWGLSQQHRLEKSRFEPPPLEDTEPDRDYGSADASVDSRGHSPALHGLPVHEEQSLDEEDEYATAEAFIAGIAEPVGSR